MLGVGLGVHSGKRTLATLVSAVFRGNAYDGLILDADDISTLNQVSTGTTPVTAVTQPVGRVLDKSGNGNHLLQATAGERPTWQVDAGGRHSLRFLGTDDNLSCATGGGGSAGFFFCASITHSPGGVIHTLFGDTGVNTGYEVEISATDKLTLSAGNGVLVTTLASTGSVAAGTTTWVTAWDDGTNLNVQVDGGTVQSVARPIVSAGSAQYTLCKDNAVALHHFVGDVYRAVYVKNSGLTAAQRSMIQAWVKAGAGL